MLIELNKLRLGNYVFDDENNIMKVSRLETAEYTDWNNGDEFSVTLEKDNHKNDYFQSTINAIPINYVWLIGLGFSIQGRMFKKDRIGIENTIDNDFWNVRILETEETSFFVKEIRFVHELQNAFFFLTDLELQRVS